MAQGDAIWALGLMSGTSMDGVDGAMILSDGVEVFEFGATGFRPYTAAERDVIAAAQGRWPGEAGVAEAGEVVERAHVELIARFGGVALVGFHGQTLAHEPSGRGTHQVGDGARLAKASGLPVVWDFRSWDVSAGGQGAPLAPFYHFALARRAGMGPVAFLNLGGVGNVSFVNPLAEGPEAPGALLAFDTGPANALMDDLMRARTGLACDYGGTMAAAGQVETDIIDGLLGQKYFSRIPPKSLDRNDFADLKDAVEPLSDTDALATLAEVTVQSVKRGFEFAPQKPSRVLVCGGGRKNDFLMGRLAAALPFPVENIDATGFDGDMLEAQAFAYLALRVTKNLALTAPGTTGVGNPMPGGRISDHK